MTLEKRIVFTVQDIKHIRVTCRGCVARVDPFCEKSNAASTRVPMVRPGVESQHAYWRRGVGVLAERPCCNGRRWGSALAHRHHGLRLDGGNDETRRTVRR